MSSGHVMARSRRSNGRQVHPKGPFETVGVVLKQRIRERMEELGWDQSDLAREIKARGGPRSEATISNMFKPGPRQIRFRALLLEVLELEDYQQVVDDKFPHLDAEDQAAVVRLVKSLTAKR